MYQTSANTVFFIPGSAKISVQSSVGSTTYTDIGSAQGIKLTETWGMADLETLSMQSYYAPFKQEVSVEADLLEYDFLKLYLMRGGIDSYSTAAGKVFTSGGLSSMYSLAYQIVNTGPTSSQAVTITIPWAHIAEAFTIPFAGDDQTDIAKMRFKITGVCQSTGTAGSMLYSITDTRTT